MKRILDGKKGDEDKGYEEGLRPQTLIEYIGQVKIKERLSIYLEAAKQRGEPVDHILLYGPPGLGKTTLAYIVAREMGVSIKSTSGPTIERPIDLLVLLKSLRKRDVLFIDEIHRLSRNLEEVLYPAMEDFVFDKVIHKGTSSISTKLNLEEFTLIGATTRVGLIAPPLRDRFGIIFHIEFYNEDDLLKIVQRSARILQVELAEEGAREIAHRSRGTPRIANRLLRRARDYAQIKANGKITGKVAREALELLDIDDLGLDEIDRKIILAIINKFDGGPVGIDTISAVVGEEAETLEELYEPYLLKLGFINKTSRGRVVTRSAYTHFNLKYNIPGTLF